MKKIGSALFLLSFCCTVFFCNSSVKSSHEDKINPQDTIKRPINISQQATLVNLGFDDMPVYFWVEYAGKLNIAGKQYPHIYGFNYFDILGKLLYTRYYENMDIRNSKKEFDATHSKILPYPGDATVQISNGTDSLLFFHVLESDEFKRNYKDIEYIRMPAIYFERINGNGFVSDYDVEFNMKKEGDIYTITFTGVPLPFRLCSACKTEPTKVSFINLYEGKIYFIEKECYLEPVNKEDLRKIQGLSSR
jgi:hypothetical protein